MVIQGVIDRSLVKDNVPHIQVDGGNIGNSKRQQLAPSRCMVQTALQVGIVQVLICTTRIVAVWVVPQISAVRISRVMSPRGIPVIADGGVRFFW